MPIKATRALLDAALSGELKDEPMRTDPMFGFQVPTALAGVDPKILNPRETWADKALRRAGRGAGRHVQEELREVRGACRCETCWPPRRC